MDVNTDGFLKIGSTHKICEDYYIVGDNYIILADGCSSCPQTDIGARVLCRCAELLIINNYDEFENFDIAEIAGNIIADASEILKTLKLPLSSYATLMFAVFKDYNIYYYSFGDGVIVKNMINNTTYVHIIDYPYNAPYYLSYIYDKNSHESYMDAFVPTGDVIYQLITKKYYGNVQSEESKIYNKNLWFNGILDAREVNSLILMSDGILSFIKNGINYDSGISIQEVNKFKNFKGEFINRRMKKVMKNFEKDGIHHYDDISVVGMNVNQ